MADYYAQRATPVTADAPAFPGAAVTQQRLRPGAPLNQDQVASYYSQEAAGYTDYPALAENSDVY